MLDSARRKTPILVLARWLLGLGIAATLAANVAHGLGHGLIGAAVAAWPAVALVGSYKLLMMVIRGAQVPADGTPESRCDADPLQEQVVEVFAEQLEADRVRLARGQTIADVIARIPAIESALGTYRGAVRVYPTRDGKANRCELRILGTDPHADAVPWSGPSALSITEPVDLGPFEDAKACRVSFLRRHALFAGTNGMLHQKMSTRPFFTPSPSTQGMGQASLVYPSDRSEVNHRLAVRGSRVTQATIRGVRVDLSELVARAAAGPIVDPDLLVLCTGCGEW